MKMTGMKWILILIASLMGLSAYADLGQVKNAQDFDLYDSEENINSVNEYNRTYRETYRIGHCIGDRDRCPSRDAVIYLPDYVEVQKITFYAHDNVGTKSDGKVNVYLNRTNLVYNENVKAAGRYHIVYPARMGDIIRFTQNQDDVYIGRVTVDYRYRYRGRY